MEKLDHTWSVVHSPMPYFSHCLSPALSRPLDSGRFDNSIARFKARGQDIRGMSRCRRDHRSPDVGTLVWPLGVPCDFIGRHVRRAEGRLSFLEFQLATREGSASAVAERLGLQRTAT